MPDQELKTSDVSEADIAMDPQYPTDEQIVKWKKEYPYSALRGYPFPNRYIVYRSYTMAEEEAFLEERASIEERMQRVMTDKEVELMLAKKYVIWPTTFASEVEAQTVPPGLPSMIANLIMVISGYADIRPEIL